MSNLKDSLFEARLLLEIAQDEQKRYERKCEHVMEQFGLLVGDEAASKGIYASPEVFRESNSLNNRVNRLAREVLELEHAIENGTALAEGVL